MRFAPPEAPAENRSSVNTGGVGRYVSAICVVNDADFGRICPQANPAWSALSTQYLLNSLLGVTSADTPIYIPPGANSTSNVTAPGPLETEDCLFLDVFVPEKILERANSSGYGAPVLVPIYSGTPTPER